MSTKRKLPQKLAQPKVHQSAKTPDKGHFNESKAIVFGGGNAMKARTNGAHEAVEISSDESEEEGEDSAEESSDESGHEQQVMESTNGVDVAMEDVVAPTAPDDEEDGGPSFGDLVRANAEQIDVAGAFGESNAVSYSRGAQLQPPSGASLGTVLAQALRTNDVSLLESCLHTTDVNIVRATVQRLESSLAATLLQKIAERLHRRPGRSGTLMVWVQWTLVTHGGYLATQRDLVKKLSDLNRVIDERAKGLQPLLSLKGKLDMLEAQIEIRKNIQRQRLGIDEDEEDEGIIYVEGQESEEEGNGNTQRHAHGRGLEGMSDSGSEISEDMPTTNGIMIDSEEDTSDDDDLLDDEAEETDADTGDEDEIDHEDYDSEAEESDDGEAAPPSKLQRMSGVISKRR
ncbi:putative U3 small nucleolar RNA-associated protein 5 [Amylocarpus encephaloides]|uniref:U3 small nucleolar RNA-associated protein 5 n=1 Tax=Amylocarpus encephaloides TaxID=45428 RepID=A0A9P8C377_9HELO|nr:putative U3 small nucleolar RNA-associated protein 5 [Amylocarpus encephaloides]